MVGRVKGVKKTITPSQCIENAVVIERVGVEYPQPLVVTSIEHELVANIGRKGGVDGEAAAEEAADEGGTEWARGIHNTHRLATLMEASGRSHYCSSKKKKKTKRN